MGQYYKAIALDNKQFLSPWEYDNGAKLMEHSWLKNDFVSAVESQLIPGGLWHKTRIVWAGDYADPDNDNIKNLYQQYSSEEAEACNVSHEVKVDKVNKYGFGRFIVNHTQNQYIDKATLPKDKDGWTIHPLPLLTCEGNGRCGGDFRGDNPWIGKWARDVISIEKKLPVRKMKPFKDFKYEQIFPDFKE